MVTYTEWLELKRHVLGRTGVRGQAAQRHGTACQVQQPRGHRRLAAATGEASRPAAFMASSLPPSTILILVPDPHPKTASTGAVRLLSSPSRRPGQATAAHCLYVASPS